MDLEIFMLSSEISQVQKAKYCMFSLICGTQTQNDDGDDGENDGT
jgi:hypothetical protein